jgi:hypothetical protein
MNLTSGGGGVSPVVRLEVLALIRLHVWKDKVVVFTLQKP